MMRHQTYFFQRTLCLIPLLVSLAFSQTASASSLVFALFGDVYMTPQHQGYLKGMLDDMARKGSELAISTGGIKPADQGCQDKNLLATYPVFAAAPLPTFTCLAMPIGRYAVRPQVATLCPKSDSTSYAKRFTSLISASENRSYPWCVKPIIRSICAGALAPLYSSV
jgi:hypothetical protein